MPKQDKEKAKMYDFVFLDTLALLALNKRETRFWIAIKIHRC